MRNVTQTRTLTAPLATLLCTGRPGKAHAPLTVTLALILLAAASAAALLFIPYQGADAASEPFQYVDRVTKISNGTHDVLSLEDHDSFGASVDIIGDVDADGVPDMMVGANGDDSHATDSGAVYLLFMNADGTARDVVKITGAAANAPQLGAGDYFGAAVAGLGDLDGDGVPDVAVGADGDDTVATDAGTVYILFLNGDGTIKRTAEINGNTPGGPTTELYDHFGFRLSNAGDINGDGIQDIVAGKYRAHGSYLFLNLPFNFTTTVDEVRAADPDEMFYGSIDIMLMDRTGAPKDTIRIDPSTKNVPLVGAFGFFGSAVAGIGDFDGDGTPDLAVGSDGMSIVLQKMCRGSSSPSTTIDNAGAIHLLLMNQDGSVKAGFAINGATPNGPDPNAYDFFGIAVSSMGDIDGDGVTDLVGGSNRGEGAGGTDTGKAQVVFMNADGTAKATQAIDGTTPGIPHLVDYGFFSFAISSSSDIDGDGRQDIVMGAYLDNISGLHDQTLDEADTLSPEERQRLQDEIAGRPAQSALGAVYVIFGR